MSTPIFLFSGLKYQDTIVNTRSNVGPKWAIASSQTAGCENISPDIVKKISAYAHSFTTCNLGTSFATTSNNSQTSVWSESIVGNPDLQIFLFLLSVV